MRCAAMRRAQGMGCWTGYMRISVLWKFAMSSTSEPSGAEVRIA